MMPANNGCFWRVLAAIVVVVMGLAILSGREFGGLAAAGFALLMLAELADIRALLRAMWTSKTVVETEGPAND